MAVCDANYCFTMIDIGGYGKDNDASIFNESKISKGFEDNLLSVLNAEEVGGSLMPFVLISDDIFAMKPWLMKAYPGKELNEDQRIYNFGHCQALRTIENTFGIMSAK